MDGRFRLPPKPPPCHFRCGLLGPGGRGGAYCELRASAVGRPGAARRRPWSRTTQARRWRSCAGGGWARGSCCRRRRDRAWPPTQCGRCCCSPASGACRCGCRCCAGPAGAGPGRGWRRGGSGFALGDQPLPPCAGAVRGRERAAGGARVVTAARPPREDGRLGLRGWQDCKHCVRGGGPSPAPGPPSRPHSLLCPQVLAAHRSGLRPAVGYELNPWLVGLARLHAWRAGCAGSVCYRREDLWKVMQGVRSPRPHTRLPHSIAGLAGDPATQLQVLWPPAWAGDRTWKPQWPHAHQTSSWLGPYSLPGRLLLAGGPEGLPQCVRVPGP